MSIGDYVSNAIDHYIEGDDQSALSDTCIALGATSRKEYPNRKIKDNEAYKKFIGNNMSILTGIGLFSMAVNDLRFPFAHKSIKGSDVRGSSLAEAIYHVARCGLVHSAEAGNFVLCENELYCDAGVLYVPKTIIVGMICSVVLSPLNKNESLKKDYILVIKSQGKPNYTLLKSWWGERASIQKTIAAGTVYEAGLINGKLLFKNGFEVGFVE